MQMQVQVGDFHPLRARFKLQSVFFFHTNPDMCIRRKSLGKMTWEQDKRRGDK